ncbi:hypothetical protein B0H11DRAFT_2067080 [Mycena galericulata]|nr:hypothetical protein B0H11DRAFT_2067080 [Mycena galericulata]
MAGPYYSYGGQAFYNPEYNYYQLSSSTGYNDGYFVRDYAGYGYGYGDYSAPTPPPRQRTPTPPPPPAEPSPEYLAISLSAQPSSVTPGQRKLLIFDLNGTLLLRSPRSYGQRKIYLRPYARSLVAYIAHPAVRAWLDCMVWSSAQAHNVREMVERVFGTGEGDGTGPILRAVWARDTLGLGREAFYQKTQTTKDLAKPWTFFASPRDSTASRPPSPSDNNAVYAAADHETGAGDDSNSSHPPPGALTSLSSPPSSPPLPPSSAPTAVSTSKFSNASSPVNTNPGPLPLPYPHGPDSTLLVDDSPLKARLQPWNHLCVAEYDAATRARDRAVASLPPDSEPSRETAPHTNGNEAGGKLPSSLRAELDGLAEESAAAVTGELPRGANTVAGKDRWRKRRREDEKAQDEGYATDTGVPLPEGVVSASAKEDAQSITAPQTTGVSKRALRRERKRLRQAEALAERLGLAPQSVEQQSAGTDEVADGSDASLSSSSPVRPLAPVEAVPENIQSSRAETQIEGPSGLEATLDAEAHVPPPVPGHDGSKKRKRELDGEEDAGTQADTIIDGDARPHFCADGEPYDPTLLAVVGVLAHVRTVGNVAAWVRSGGLAAAYQDACENGQDSEVAAPLNNEDTANDKIGNDAPAHSEAETALSSDPNQWFASKRLLTAWAARGRAALAELGIEAAPGVE